MEIKGKIKNISKDLEKEYYFQLMD